MLTYAEFIDEGLSNILKYCSCFLSKGSEYIFGYFADCQRMRLPHHWEDRCLAEMLIAFWDSCKVVECIYIKFESKALYNLTFTHPFTLTQQWQQAAM